MTTRAATTIANAEDLGMAITSLVGRDSIIPLHVAIVEFCKDDHAVALFLQNCLYWQGKSSQPGRFYKTYAEWRQETRLSDYQVRRAARKLEEYVHTEVHRANGLPVVHYYVDVARFSDAFLKFLKKRSLSFSRNETEETTETLTSTTASSTLSNCDNDGKNAFGEQGNVFLTEVERQKLINRFGAAEALTRIEDFSLKLAAKGYEYRSHYHAILSWARKDEAGKAGANKRADGHKDKGGWRKTL